MQLDSYWSTQTHFPDKVDSQVKNFLSKGRINSRYVVQENSSCAFAFNFRFWSILYVDLFVCDVCIFVKYKQTLYLTLLSRLVLRHEEQKVRVMIRHSFKDKLFWIGEWLSNFLVKLLVIWSANSGQIALKDFLWWLTFIKNWSEDKRNVI